MPALRENTIKIKNIFAGIRFLINFSFKIFEPFLTTGFYNSIKKFFCNCHSFLPFKLVYVVSAFQTKSSICISCGNITLTLGFAEDIGKIGKVKNM